MNSTDVLPTPGDTAMTVAEIIETIFLGGVFLVGTIGNLLVIMAVATTPALQVAYNIFIVVLALTDLVTSAFLTPFFMLTLVCGGWPLKNAMCVGIGYLTIVCLTTSGLTVNCIAVCRYVTIAYTDPVRRKLIHRRVVITASCLLVVFLTGAVTLPSFGIGDVTYNDRLGHCTLNYVTTSEWYYTAMMFSLGLVFTLTTVPISYGLIFWIVHKSRVSIENIRMASRAELRAGSAGGSGKGKPNNPQALQQRKAIMGKDELRLTKKLLLLFGAFLGCWIPYTSVVLADKHLTVPQYAHRGTNILLWLNACLNPFLYAWMIRNFRQAYRRIITSMFCRKNNMCMNR